MAGACIARRSASRNDRDIIPASRHGMESSLQVPADEVVPAPLSVSDAGRVFWWKGRLFRGIPADHAASYRALFECGLIQELVAKGLFVESSISSLRVQGYDLVIEHEVIDVPVYPREWTFSMLKDAALLVLRINEIASRYGYQTKDCHGYNILFHRSRPVYVDLGSFAPFEPAGHVLFAYHEFMRTYCYPLEMWRTGGQFYGLRAVPRIGFVLPVAAYMKYRWPLLRRATDALLSRTVQRLHAVRTLPYRDLGDFDDRYGRWTRGILRWLKSSRLLSRPATIPVLERRIRAMRPRANTTSWSDYQDEMGTGGARALTPRFQQVVSRLESLGVRSVLEIAGNQGVLARHLAERGTIDRIICTDADGPALDKGYAMARDQGLAIQWAIFNPFSYEQSRLEVPFEERFRSDAVVALALTHHLLLTQSLGLRYVLEVLGSFASKFVLIEYMPLGLYNGTHAVPTPSWYTESWFREEFERQFDLVERTQLDTNRILFIGRVKESAT